MYSFNERHNVLQLASIFEQGNPRNLVKLPPVPPTRFHSPHFTPLRLFPLSDTLTAAVCDQRYLWFILEDDGGGNGAARQVRRRYETLCCLSGVVTVARAHLGVLFLGTDGGRVFAYRFAEEEDLLEDYGGGGFGLGESDWSCRAEEGDGGGGVGAVVAVDAAYVGGGGLSVGGEAEGGRIEVTFATRSTLHCCYWMLSEEE